MSIWNYNGAIKQLLLPNALCAQKNFVQLSLRIKVRKNSFNIKLSVKNVIGVITFT